MLKAMMTGEIPLQGEAWVYLGVVWSKSVYRDLLGVCACVCVCVCVRERERERERALFTLIIPMLVTHCLILF